MKKYKTFEDLIADQNEWSLFCELDEMVMNNALDAADMWDGYEEAMEEGFIDDFILEVAHDDRMSQIHQNSFEVFFTDAPVEEVNPNAVKLYQWYKEY
jgi:hypothetical protein